MSGRIFRAAGVLSAVPVLLVTFAVTAQASVVVSRAELSGTRLRLEGQAGPNRAITVDGTAMTTSGSTGSFRIDRSGFVAPADCTVDVNDGSVTAVNVTLEAIYHLRTTGSSHSRAFLVETMGRDCGYIAIMAGLAGGAEVISVPENQVTAREIAERLSAAYERGKTHAIVVIAEGVKENSAKIISYFETNKQMVGFELRTTVLGHVVRGAPPTAFDRVLATRLGVNAVKALSDGEFGVLVGWQKDVVTRTPLAEVAGRTKAITTELVELARVLAR